jgi:hypothetical protein
MIALLVVAGVLALLPPFFTRGTCTAEFNATSDEMEQARPELSTLEHAQSYLGSRSLPYHVVSPEHCPHWPGVEECGGGPLLLVDVPVKNTVCHYYRAGSIQVQLAYDGHSRLVHYQADMPPFHYLRVPAGWPDISWAR